MNIAARLESVPGDYKCRLVVGERTAVLVRDEFLICELDWLKVKGKREAISVFEVVVEQSDATDEERAYVEGFGAALALYRAGDFVAAGEAFHACVHPNYPEGGPPKVMAERCDEMQLDPPDPWDGIFVKTSK